MEPHLIHLLNSNEALEERAIREVKELLKGPLKKLDDIDAETAALQARLKLLEERRLEINGSIADYYTLLSPIRQLPHDILYEIFCYLLPIHRNSLISASEAPLLLTHVCRKWRSVALSSPRLWSRLHITFSDAYRPDRAPVHGYGYTPNSSGNPAFVALKRRCDVVKEWLRRSGRHPLSISIYYRSTAVQPLLFGMVNRADNLTRELLEIVTPTCERWRSLELCIPADVFRQLRMMMPSSDSCQLLTSVKLNFYPRPDHDFISGVALANLTQSEIESSLDVFLNAPQVQKLTLERLYLSQLSTVERVPYPLFNHNLTHFCSRMILSFSESLGLFRHCPGLVHCKVHVAQRQDDPSGAPGDAYSPVILSRLLTLSISEHGIEKGALDYFYSSFQAPSLKWMDYRKPYGVGWSHLPVRVLIETCHQLQKLTIDPNDFNERSLLQILETVSSNLKHLVLGKEPLQSLNNHPVETRRSNSTPSFDLSWLLVNPWSMLYNVLLPKLEIFEWSPGSANDKTVLHFITGRLRPLIPPGVAPLKKVHIIFDISQKIDIAQELGRLKRDARESGSQNAHLEELELRLIYSPTPTKGNDRFSVPGPSSSSLRLSSDNRTWGGLEIDESLTDIYN
ncbi:hypothetical protein CVT26_008325 [Gymnopilus dilepis]|uniref:F-box domain-containing protein n=1 Tax=Gymnopilus dilepis TaxID=231916 RepID=A0A409XY91_9AGAR|nr:hypothetical protein CVT26_008325 [Gymnopilus dilepis]